jgi:hypothetical protein
METEPLTEVPALDHPCPPCPKPTTPPSYKTWHRTELPGCGFRKRGFHRRSGLNVKIYTDRLWILTSPRSGKTLSTATQTAFTSLRDSSNSRFWTATASVRLQRPKALVSLRLLARICGIANSRTWGRRPTTMVRANTSALLYRMWSSVVMIEGSRVWR